MKKIAWSKAFSVGVRALDDQHKRIIGVLNELTDDPQAKVDSELISDTLTRLTRYAVEHFREEERLMGLCEYPGIEEHKDRHREFRQKIVECCMAATLHVASVPGELLTYLRDWFKDHILHEDMKYKPFLAGRQMT